MAIASSYMVNYLRIFSYIRNPFLMTLQPIPSEFPYIWGRFRFLFISALYRPRSLLYFPFLGVAVLCRRNFRLYVYCKQRELSPLPHRLYLRWPPVKGASLFVSGCDEWCPRLQRTQNKHDSADHRKTHPTLKFRKMPTTPTAAEMACYI
jgi:hypothetical protein